MSERHITIDIIIAAVSAVTGISRGDILSDLREPTIVRARFAAIWISSKMTLLSRPALGRIFGDRDHTTILSALRRVEEMRADSHAYRVDTDAILGTLLAIERNGLIRLAETIDPLATAHRVLANPMREAVRVSSHEIIALCQVAAAALGEGPNDPAPMETEHAA